MCQRAVPRASACSQRCRYIAHLCVALLCCVRRHKSIRSDPRVWPVLAWKLPWMLSWREARAQRPRDVGAPAHHADRSTWSQVVVCRKGTNSAHRGRRHLQRKLGSEASQVGDNVPGAAGRLALSSCIPLLQLPSGRCSKQAKCRVWQGLAVHETNVRCRAVLDIAFVVWDAEAHRRRTVKSQMPESCES